MTRKAIFLDRDGVINKKPPEGRYVTCWEEFSFLPGARKAIRRINESEFLAIVATNQRGVARDLYSEDTLNDIHDRMQDRLKDEKAHIDHFEYCPHAKNSCQCRKPQTGMLDSAREHFSLTPSECWFIGDSLTDIQAGDRFGCNTIFIYQPDEEDSEKKKKKIERARILSEHACTSLLEAVRIILGQDYFPSL